MLWGASLIACGSAYAHGGGLDANGCHHDRKHGGYHCHRGSAPRAPTPNFAPTPMPRQRLRGDDNDSISYANCSAARAAGAAPVRRGDPGYGRHLDRDGDGVGCE
ncbi:excalibur calcium-binding domain-containing protein [Lysobacter terrestris]|uniref:Excalibur calcium-binding domain-containing protein n=1 Tax=Agrilutibacter terrestris TaxID=2865112 RepID=A0A7H0G1E2_9GAMM|nr:excalibur calcium-binding domain-containing protein [Lysobacter terrestris]